MLPLEDSTKEENVEEEVYLIAGVINATGKMLYWKNDIVALEVGDYAIVENMNNYDLVKVVGIVSTTKKEASKFSNTQYKNMKKTVFLIKKEELR